ncbi:hypothetical protein [Spirillospora sp. NPDC029432]|uniref:hypothetical protein n=1 Tax=Spirillospora sp. NPDC029432 TaxID=3154599 RepID=UPI0034554BE5
MRARARSAAPHARAAAGCAVLALGLALAGCGGDDKPPASAGASSSPPIPVPSVPIGSPSAGASKLEKVPKVQAGQIRPLVGRWNGPNGDYFLFKTDGSGAWMKGRQALWNGQVIPEGKGKYRFSWQGGDPKSASYWGATLNAGGTKMVFAGTNQTYTKAKG